jgi:hypothetical protein
MKRSLFLSLLMAVVILAAAWLPAWGARRALLVGVEEYATPEYNLKGVRDDIRLLEQSFADKGLFSEKETKVLLDREATRANILKAFREWLIQGTSPGDTALFYFSGHGIQLWGESGHKMEDGMDEALTPYDGRALERQVQRKFRGRPGMAYTLAGTENVILDREIGELLQELKGRKVIFISDSCHSGTVYRRVNPHYVTYKTIGNPVSSKSVFEPRVAEGDLGSINRDRPNILANVTVPEDTSLIVFTASEASQPAEIVLFDQDPKGLHSVFTWYFLNGLAGKADLNRNGKITFGDLATFLNQEVTRDGYAQTPQHKFEPKALADEVFVSRKPPSDTGRVERPTRISCGLRIDESMTSAEKKNILATLKESSLPVQWTQDPGTSACLIEVQKSSGAYGARLSDATGAYWEAHRGSTLKKVLEAVLQNLRACYVQMSMATLRNPATRMMVELEYTVRARAERKPGEVVKGDALTFRAKAETPGYLIILSVDCVGVIHPLYPEAGATASKLKPKDVITVGADGLSITVQEPFGKEVIFAFLTSHPLESLTPFWATDDVGDVASAGLADQAAFLDALWNELVDSGKPRDDWTSRLWSVQSFSSAK